RERDELPEQDAFVRARCLAIGEDAHRLSGIEVANAIRAAPDLQLHGVTRPVAVALAREMEGAVGQRHRHEDDRGVVRWPGEEREMTDERSFTSFGEQPHPAIKLDFVFAKRATLGR